MWLYSPKIKKNQPNYCMHIFNQLMHPTPKTTRRKREQWKKCLAACIHLTNIATGLFVPFTAN